MASDKPQIPVIHPIVTDSPHRVQFLEDVLVHAGFPSPVEDAYMSQPIDLNEHLIEHPATTFMMKAVGDSMIEEGIDEGDYIVVDRSLYANERNIAVCMYEGEFALKRIVQRDGRIFLCSGNHNYPPIEVTDPDRLRVWGIVRWVLKKK